MLIKHRIIAIVMLVWLPLLIISIIDSVALTGVKVPFLLDIDTHVRFVGSVTMLVLADVIVYERTSEIISQFIKRNIITPESKPKFDAYVKSAAKLRSSITIEIVLLILVVSCGYFVWKSYRFFNESTWYATISNGNVKLNLAGYWYIFISLPIFQFLLLRWYFRIFVWYKLLWQISRLPLSLNSLHPDRAGGLGFLTESISAFSLVLLAHTVFLAGIITHRIVHYKATLLDFKIEIITIAGFLVVLVLLPLVFFIFAMAQNKRIGTNKYGVMASHFVNMFYNKWLDNMPIKDLLLGSADVQSLADLSNSFIATRDMKIVPFSFTNVLQLIVLILLPLFPLAFTLMPTISIIRGIVKIFI